MFRGYNHKLPVLVRAILQRMRALTIDPKRFALIKEQIERGLRNFDLEQPYSHAIYEMGLFTDAKVWSHKERLAVIGSLTPEDVKGVCTHLTSTSHTATACICLTRSLLLSVVRYAVQTTSPVSCRL